MRNLVEKIEKYHCFYREQYNDVELYLLSVFDIDVEEKKVQWVPVEIGRSQKITILDLITYCDIQYYKIIINNDIQKNNHVNNPKLSN